MPIDLNSLPIEPTEPVDIFDSYEEPREYPPPVAKGQHRLKLLKIECDKHDEKTNTLTFLADWEAFDAATGQSLGKINFDRIRTSWYGQQKTRNDAVDHLRAFGITDRPRSLHEWGQLMASTKAMADQGELIDAAVDWRGYCAHSGTQFETEFDAPAKTPGRKALVPQTAPHRDAVELRSANKWPETGANGTRTRDDSVPCHICQQPIRARAEITRKIPKSY